MYGIDGGLGYGLILLVDDMLKKHGHEKHELAMGLLF